MTADWTEIKIPVPWGHISGKWWGSTNKRPILMVHGYMDNAGSFDLLVPLLPKNFSYLCIDLPGHGLSSHVPEGQMYYFDTDSMLAVRRVVKHFGWSSVALIGHSIGAVICLMYASNWPLETELVVSIDSIQPGMSAETVVSKTSGNLDSFLEYEKNLKEIASEYSYEEAMKLFTQQYNITEKTCNVLLKRGLRKLDNGKYTLATDLRLQVLNYVTTIPTAIEYAKRVRCRYLHIKFVPGHSFDKEQVLQIILNVIKTSSPEFKLVRVKGYHHNHLDAPESVSPIIDDFISARLQTYSDNN